MSHRIVALQTLSAEYYRLCAKEGRLPFDHEPSVEETEAMHQLADAVLLKGLNSYEARVALERLQITREQSGVEFGIVASKNSRIAGSGL